MKRTSVFFAAVSAVVVLCGAARAGDNILLAVNKPARAALAIKTADLAPKATEQVKTQAAEPDDFDALSTVNDPLYREGSREFLEQVSKQDDVKTVKKEPVKEVLRDAPNAPAPAPAAAPVKPQPVIRRSKLMKVVPADPVKSRNTL